MEGCLFCKFAHHEIPKEFIYEDENIMVFPDIHPTKPIHILVVPKKHITEFVALKDEKLLGQIMHVIQKMIKENGLSTKGYQIVVNGGGLQQIDHLHFHVKGPWSS